MAALYARNKVVYCTTREEHEDLLKLPESTEGVFDPTRPEAWKGFVRFTSDTAAHNAARDDEQENIVRPHR